MFESVIGVRMCSVAMRGVRIFVVAMNVVHLYQSR